MTLKFTRHILNLRHLPNRFAYGVLPAILATMTVQSAAYADWQFAKWGMTPAELVAASDGTVKMVLKTEENNDAYLKAVYVTGERKFDVSFKFQKQRLVRVILRDQDYHKICGPIARQLTVTYGKPYSYSSYTAVYWNTLNEEYYWNDPGTGNAVAFYSNQHGCFIHYDQLKYERGL